MANWTKDNIPNLDEKVIIVTGANSGIGYECSLELAEKAQLLLWPAAIWIGHNAHWKQSGKRFHLPSWN